MNAKYQNEMLQNRPQMEHLLMDALEFSVDNVLSSENVPKKGGLKLQRDLIKSQIRS